MSMKRSLSESSSSCDEQGGSGNDNGTSVGTGMPNVLAGPAGRPGGADQFKVPKLSNQQQPHQPLNLSLASQVHAVEGRPPNSKSKSIRSLFFLQRLSTSERRESQTESSTAESASR